MERIEFFIPGTPTPKQSMRIGRKNGKMQTFTAAPVVNYQNLIKLQAHQAMQGRPLITGPVTLNIVIYFLPPTSLTKKEKALLADGKLYPLVRPDRDNCLKGIQDGLNGIVYVDDKQVVDGVLQKRYGNQKGVQVEILWGYDN